MVNVGIVGGSGYAGGEIMRLLLRHPGVDICSVSSRRFADDYVHMIHPNLRGVTEMKFSLPNYEELGDNCEAVFLATPHGVSKDIVPDLLESGLKVIDLSADFRLSNPEDYPKWYKWKHPYPDLLKMAIYGVPEIHREEIRNADLVACGGCMSTATILGLAPVIKAGLVEPDRIVVDVKIGSSGGGSEPTLAAHHPERFGSLRPYNVVGHRHTVEIEQEISKFSEKEIRIAFTPHAINMARGILSTCHLWVSSPLENRDLWRAYREFYDGEPFIHLVKYRKGLYQLPDPRVVTGTNNCEIGFEIDPHINRLVVFSAIDNIVKGAAGQAVHCFNLMYDFEETKGLDLVSFH
jgi:N-acetyl-gamma-glutamyl-phosphate/LysW-gamma-L-alpha-aminoadipyl-6-phosphate reductase